MKKFSDNFMKNIYILPLILFISFSNIVFGGECIDGEEVELWGKCYNIDETMELDLNGKYTWGTEIKGKIPVEIGDLTNLTHIDLRFQQLTGEIPPEIGNLKKLKSLSLSNNQFTGSIPREIGNLTNLIYLYLSSNKLSGKIPSEIGNLKNLKVLSLSDNQLTGSIPPEIEKLTNIKYLSIKDNQLTGEIPEGICDLNKDGPYTLKINNNQFCPPFPSCIGDNVGKQDTSDCN